MKFYSFTGGFSFSESAFDRKESEFTQSPRLTVKRASLHPESAFDRKERESALSESAFDRKRGSPHSQSPRSTVKRASLYSLSPGLSNRRGRGAKSMIQYFSENCTWKCQAGFSGCRFKLKRCYLASFFIFASGTLKRGRHR